MEMALAIWIGSAFLCWGLANSKARIAGGWFLAALAFGPLALVVLAVLPSRVRDKSAPSPETHVKCPDCRELVLRDARRCRHCDCSLVPQ